jgi:hypothetical protein
MRPIPVDHTSPAIASQIHRVQMLACAQEARLLGAVDFPPLRRTVEDIRTCDEEFFAATRLRRAPALVRRP